MVRYREKVTARFPSLPQRSGRALSSLPAVEQEAARRAELRLQAIAHPPPHRPKSQRLPQHRGPYHLTVRGALRTDIPRIVRAIVEMERARLRAEQVQDQADASSSSTA